MVSVLLYSNCISIKYGKCVSMVIVLNVVIILVSIW